MEPTINVTLVVFRIGERHIGLPVAAVGRVSPVVEILPLPGAPPHVSGTINLHGQVTAVLDLAVRFGAPPQVPHIDASLVTVQTPSRRVALLADAVRGVTVLPRSALVTGASIARGAALVSGIAAVPDGLVYVYDPESLFSFDEEAVLDAALEQASGAC